MQTKNALFLKKIINCCFFDKNRANYTLLWYTYSGDNNEELLNYY